MLSAPDSFSQVLYCSICQGDLAKVGAPRGSRIDRQAAVNFWQCEACEAVAVCLICYRAAGSSATVTTYRAAALKRRSQALLGVPRRHFGMGTAHFPMIFHHFRIENGSKRGRFLKRRS